MTEPDFDAVVVGASVAGCTAARLFAKRGARRAPAGPRRLQTVCTHYIQPSATPTIERLGLAALIEERGAVRNSIDFWTPYGGWIRHRPGAPHGYNVTRQVLDPLLRRMAAETPGVELLLGHTAPLARGAVRPRHARAPGAGGLDGALQVGGVHAHHEHGDER